jgi:hypothetical protein
MVLARAEEMGHHVPQRFKKSLFLAPRNGLRGAIRGADPRARSQEQGRRTRTRARGAVVRFGRNAPTPRFRERIREELKTVSRKLSGCEGARDSRAVSIRVRR